MEDTLLTKADLAERWQTSEKSIGTACTRNPSSLPKYMKLGVSKNSPIRFRLEDCLTFEAEMLAHQEQTLARMQTEVTDLAQLLNL